MNVQVNYYITTSHYLIGKEALPESDNEINPSNPEPGYRQNEHLPPSEMEAPVGTRAELRCSVQNRSISSI